MQSDKCNVYLFVSTVELISDEQMLIITFVY